MCMTQTAMDPDTFRVLLFSIQLECKRCIFFQSSVCSSHSNSVLFKTVAHLQDTVVLLISVKVVNSAEFFGWFSMYDRIMAGS